MPESSSSGKGPLGQVPHQMPHIYHPVEKKDLGKRGDRDKKDKKRATPIEVKQFHEASDKDSGYRAQHHTLGPNSTQAAPGNHQHRLIGIFLYRGTTTNHNSNGNYINLPWDKYNFWDKEYYAKNTNAIITVLKPHTALITYRISFTGTAGGGGAGGTGRRGIRLITGIGNTQTFELASLGGGTTSTRVHDVAMAIDLSAGENVNVDYFQNCGGTLDAEAGLHVTNLKIIKTHPNRLDIQSLSTGDIVPQLPGPEIASRQLYLAGNW